MHGDDHGVTGPSRRSLLAATAGVGAGLLAGCLGGGGGDADDPGAGGDGEWRSIELSTVRGDETFTVDGLDGPVVIQSFAVWCPKCERQSGELAAVADSLTVVGLNTDPNEDAAKVRNHADDNGFDWRFAVSPSEMTQALVDDFGSTVTNAPSTPIVVACEGGGAEFMSGSVQGAGEIESAAGNC